MQRKNWFFDSPPTEDGERFTRKNIPAEATYRELISSTPFFLEPSDQASVTRQGLVKVYTDDQVISSRNSSVVPKGLRKVVSSFQMPSVGILDSGNYRESNPSTTEDGPEITGGGIRVKGIRHFIGTAKRIAYRIEFDPSPFPILSEAEINTMTLYGIAYNPDNNKNYLYPLRLKGDNVYGENSYTHTQNVASDNWIVTHNMSFEPNVTIEIVVNGSFVTTNAEVTYVTDSQLTVKFNALHTGRVICS